MAQFNYGVSRWNLFPRYSGRISYFWKGVLNCLPALGSCVAHGILLGTKTLFGKDQWLNGLAPMNIWLEEFRKTLNPNGSVHDLDFLCSEEPFMENEDVVYFRNRSRGPERDRGDKKWWRLTGNSVSRSNHLWLPK